MKEILINHIFPAWYKLCAKKKIKNKALFIEIREKKLTSNFAGIIEFIRKKSCLNDIKVQKHFLLLGGTSMPGYVVRCFLLMPKLATAKYAFISDSSNVIAALKLRKETTLVQTWHACGALKKFGNSIGADNRYYGNESIMTVSSENVVDFYHEATGLDVDRIYPIGVSRTDIFYQEKFKKNCCRLREHFLKGRNKKIILYAPTYRGNVADASQVLPDFSLFHERLGQEYIMLVKLHSAISCRIDDRYSEFLYDISDSISIENAMGICDILITDYSSLIFEYALLGKPAVFYAPDYEAYCVERGFYIDYLNEMPGKVCYSPAEVIIEIKNGAFDVNRMKRFRNKYMSACDGNSTKRLAGLVFEKQNL